jgi:hypothetical protein
MQGMQRRNGRISAPSQNHVLDFGTAWEGMSAGDYVSLAGPI